MTNEMSRPATVLLAIGAVIAIVGNSLGWLTHRDLPLPVMQMFGSSAVGLAFIIAAAAYDKLITTKERREKFRMFIVYSSLLLGGASLISGIVVLAIATHVILPIDPGNAPLFQTIAYVCIGSGLAIFWATVGVEMRRTEDLWTHKNGAEERLLDKIFFPIVMATLGAAVMTAILSF